MATDTVTLDMTRIPRHVAIIMDGNGRWAKQHGWMRSKGHEEGVTSVHNITETASNLGVEYLTLYTFSTENWNRPAEEVDMLMQLVVNAIEKETEMMLRKNVRLEMIGDRSRIPAPTLARLDACMATTAHCTGLRLVLALSYSSRWEITEAVRAIATEAQRGAINPEEITEETVNAYLTTASMPDPDLLIRTGGDLRISNYLLWQIAYSEIYITDTYWPDFGAEEFIRAIADFQKRERRFGRTSEQVNTTN